jgi:hypothetical protein
VRLPKKDSKEARRRAHDKFAKKLISNLYSHLLDFAGEKLTDFSKYPRTFIEVPYQINGSQDCCFHVMISLEHYDADNRQLKYKFPVIS